MQNTADSQERNRQIFAEILLESDDWHPSLDGSVPLQLRPKRSRGHKILLLDYPARAP